MPLWPDLWRLRRIDETAHEALKVAREALATARHAVGLLQPKLAHIAIVLEDNMSLDVGKSFVATVEGRDQFGQPFPLDFTTETPQWTVADPALATITPDAQAGSEDVTGAAPGSETLSVTFGGLSASLAFDVTQAAAVLTSLVITANPQV